MWGSMWTSKKSNFVVIAADLLPLTKLLAMSGTEVQPIADNFAERYKSTTLTTKCRQRCKSLPKIKNCERYCVAKKS